MKILSLETSVQPGSLALLVDGRIVFETLFPADRRTTESFAPALESALEHFGRPANQLDAIAVCEGPGSFTGLRIGITCAKSFAYAAGIGVVVCDSLQVIAQQASLDGTPVWSIMDAQRGQLFASFFARGEPLVPTCVLDVEEWLVRLETGQVVTGPGLRRIRSRIPGTVKIADESLWMPSAVMLAKLAEARFQAGVRADIWSLTPKYYRPSAAEEKVRNHVL